MLETRKSAESANKRADALEERQRDRTLTKEQRAQFRVLTAAAPKGRIRIKILIGEGGEPTRFAQSLRQMLEESGFTIIDPTSSFMVSGDISGLYLKVKNTSRPPNHTRIVQQGLQSVGISAPAAPEDDAFLGDLSENEVVIYVYKKP